MQKVFHIVSREIAHWQGNCEKCINLCSNSQLPNGKSPKEGNVLSVMRKSLREDPGHKTSRLTYMSLDLMLHWIYCNIYIQSHKTVKKKIEELYKEYKFIKDYVKKERWNLLESTW